jgi:ATP-dependent RNA helicase HelY
VRRTLARELETIKAPRGRATPSRSRVAQLVRAYESHPVHTCADVDDHVKIASKLKDVTDEIERIDKRMSARRDTIARSFERVLRVLETLGYADGWRLTDKGELLSRVYNESDLLVVECLIRGWFAGLDPDELAAVASLFVYEPRGRDEPEPAPTPTLGRYERRVTDLFTSLAKEESRNDVELLKAPDAGFMGQIYEWAGGATLEDVLSERETSAGDFVRWAKQVVDLLQQLRQVAAALPPAELAVTTKEAIARVQRGVVAYSSIV